MSIDLNIDSIAETAINNEILYLLIGIVAKCISSTAAACFPARYMFTALVSIGLAIIYGLKVNLSVAIVAMINNTALAQARIDDHHGHHNPITADTNGTHATATFACAVPDDEKNATATTQVTYRVKFAKYQVLGHYHD